jgi:hypothetical protein
MAPSSLPPAPARLVHERGIPAFGTYRGHIGQLSWQALRMPALSRLLRPLHHKRWQYAAIAHAHYFIGVAVVDVGWISTAFAYLFDRRQRTLLASFSADGIPLLSTQLENRPFGDATFQRGGQRIAFRRAEQRIELTINTAALKLAAHIALPAAEQTLAVIAPANWLAHATHKSSALAVSGFAECAGERFVLDGAVASLDASNGLLARHTHWCWASAHSPALGFNLQAGYMGDAENAIWLDGELFAVGSARFSYNAANPLAPWHIHTDDGTVNLQFQPEGARAENKNLLIAASRYVQPIGTFSGTLIHPETGRAYAVAQLAGVTEDHYSTW